MDFTSRMLRFHENFFPFRLIVLLTIKKIFLLSDGEYFIFKDTMLHADSDYNSDNIIGQQTSAQTGES